MAIDLKERVRDVPDWPQQGVVFRDITPLLRDPEALDQTVHELAAWGKDRKPDVVLGAEARGFILGAASAREHGWRLGPARRPGDRAPAPRGDPVPWPAPADTRAALSRFRRLERLPGAAHPAVFGVRFECGCGDEHPGLVTHEELDWTPLGLGAGGSFLNLMTDRLEGLEV